MYVANVGGVDGILASITQNLERISLKDRYVQYDFIYKKHMRLHVSKEFNLRNN